MQYRQGDVFVERIESDVPADAVEVPREAGNIVLAHGEATGHAHTIAAKSARLLMVGAERFLTVKRPVTLKHQEHAPVTIPAGTYRVGRQREYAPEAIRNVAD